MFKKKNKRKIETKELIFVIVNSLLIVSILSYYGYRLLKYKNYFDSLSTNVSNDRLVTVIINKMMGKENDDLYIENEEKGMYSFRPTATTNYVSYSGRIYRILDIDEYSNMHIISEEPESVFVTYSNESFPQSDLYQWLNPSDKEHSGIFYNSLVDPDLYLTSGCKYSVVNNIEQIGKNVISLSDMYCGMLTLEEYQKYGGNNSFVNNGTNFMLASFNDDGYYWMVNSDGSVAINDSAVSCCNIKAVLTLSFETYAHGGNGTKEDPYIITACAKSASGICVGEYIKYSESLFRVVENGTNPVAISVNPVEKMSFGDNSKFSVKYGLGKYLNTSYLNSLDKYEDYLVKNDYYTGSFVEYNTFSYFESFSSTVNCYCAVPSVGQLMLNQNKGGFLTNGTETNDQIIYSLTDESVIYGDLVDNDKFVYPLITFKGELNVKDGNGTMQNPYVLEAVVDENKQ